MPGAALPTATGGPRENIGLLYQEILTVITRLGSNRQSVADASAFRNQVKSTISTAEAEAFRRGYPAEDARLATFAVVAFLDESVLNSRNPVFADWPRLPLQQELFGVGVAGEIYFQCINRLLTRNDSAVVADVLEVFAICLALGYRGRYSHGGQEGIRPILNSIQEKIQRIRGASLPMSPNWAPPKDAPVRAASDPVARWLGFYAIGSVALALMTFLLFKILLVSGASGLHAVIISSH